MASQNSNKVVKMDKKPGTGIRLHEVRLTAGPNGELPPEDDLSFLDEIDAKTAPYSTLRQSWPLTASQTWFWFRILAGGLFAAFLIAWPIGKALAYRNEYGTLKAWNFFASYDAAIILYAITVPLLILIIGYVVAIGMRITSAAEEVSFKANQLIRPETTALRGVKTVGSAVRGEIDALNSHVDDALARLASVESMIRQQIKAIDTAGTAIESGGSVMSDRVSGERRKLIELTEAMNSEADAFAAAIAEKAKLGLEKTETANARLLGAEQELDTRLDRLETIAEKAYDSFETLSNTLIKQEEMLVAKSAHFDETVEDAARRNTDTQKALEENTAALASAQSLLQRESERLETLIIEQRERAERLAATISAQAKTLAAPLSASTTHDTVPDGQSNQITDEPVADPKDTTGTVPYYEAPRFDIPTTDPTAVPAPMSNAALPTAAPIMQVPSKSHDPSAALPTHNAAQTTPTLDTSTPPQKRAWSEILAAAEQTSPQEEAGLNNAPAENKASTDVTEPTPEAPPVSSTSHVNDPVDNQNGPAASDTPPADIYASSAASSENDVVNLIRSMQAFTLRMMADLYETPQSAALERFENGERNLFAHLLLGKDEADLQQRIKIEVSKHKSFGIATTEFLYNFDQLLEPANASGASDSLLNDYLGSPLGQLYILTGSAVDYFS